MRLKKILACCSLMAVALSASAGVELTFEDRGTGFNALDSAYKGASFIGGAFSLGSKSAGGIGNFEGLTDGGAHPTNNVAMIFNNDGVDQADPGKLVINFNAGFSTSFQMLYSAIGSFEGTGVEVWSGLDGTGTLLSSSDAFASLNQSGCAVTIACAWGGINLDLGKSIAHSIVIHGPDDTYFFDNIIFGDLPSGTGGGDVPEPTGTALTLAALGALAFTRRRRS